MDMTPERLACLRVVSAGGGKLNHDDETLAPAPATIDALRLRLSMAGQVISETAAALGCIADNEVILVAIDSLKADNARLRELLSIGCEAAVPLDADYDDMHHALGRPKNLGKNTYRNYYCIDVGDATAARFEALGWWKLNHLMNEGRSAVYAVNDTGKAALAGWLATRAFQAARAKAAERADG